MWNLETIKPKRFKIWTIRLQFSTETSTVDISPYRSCSTEHSPHNFVKTKLSLMWIPNDRNVSLSHRKYPVYVKQHSMIKSELDIQLSGIFLLTYALHEMCFLWASPDFHLDCYIGKLWRTNRSNAVRCAQHHIENAASFYFRLEKLHNSHPSILTNMASMSALGIVAERKWRRCHVSCRQYVQIFRMFDRVITRLNASGRAHRT